jgi:hypothetical protein
MASALPNGAFQVALGTAEHPYDDCAAELRVRRDAATGEDASDGAWEVFTLSDDATVPNELRVWWGGEVFAPVGVGAACGHGALTSRGVVTGAGPRCAACRGGGHGLPPAPHAPHLAGVRVMFVRGDDGALEVGVALAPEWLDSELLLDDGESGEGDAGGGEEGGGEEGGGCGEACGGDEDRGNAGGAGGGEGGDGGPGDEGGGGGGEGGDGGGGGGEGEGGDGGGGGGGGEGEGGEGEGGSEDDGDLGPRKKRQCTAAARGSGVL